MLNLLIIFWITQARCTLRALMSGTSKKTFFFFFQNVQLLVSSVTLSTVYTGTHTTVQYFEHFSNIFRTYFTRARLPRSIEPRLRGSCCPKRQTQIQRCPKKFIEKKIRMVQWMSDIRMFKNWTCLKSGCKLTSKVLAPNSDKKFDSNPIQIWLKPYLSEIPAVVAEIVSVLLCNACSN